MKKLLTILLCFTSFVLSSCQSEEEKPSVASTGTIVLSLGGAQLYTELQTRAEQPVGDITRYTFTLNGTTIGGAPVTNQPVSFDDSATAEVAAGTYTLTADNATYANEDNGHPYYRGTSTSFTVTVGNTQPVGIILGKPQNARITLALDASFTALYENPVVTLSDNNRAITMSSTQDECYFIIPASQALAYTITADALSGSHVTDMINSTGYVSIQAGYNTTITLKANPATGIIIPVVSGEHTGSFD